MATQVDAFSIQQIVAGARNGKLSDNSEASADFREYLQIAKSENLARYVQACLQSSFERSGSVLQDLVNELGRRLDYTVENGLYQGKSNAIGFDGLWTAPDEHVIVVEVKTSDAYRINLDTIAAYREQLMNIGKVPKKSSVLLVVGRQDTGDLEAQVRGSKHAWSFRIISADALIKLVTLKENAELASVAKIHELLVPFEYTRLDKIIDIAFTVAEDTSIAAEGEDATSVDVKPLASTMPTEPTGQQHTSAEIMNEVRVRIVSALSVQNGPLVKKSRALYSSVDKSVRAAITISKEYEYGNYWYAYRSSWDAFLKEGEKGLYVLGCIGRDEAFALPYEWIHSRLKSLYATTRESGTHWHIYLLPSDTGTLTMRLNDGTSEAWSNSESRSPSCSWTPM